MCQGFSFELWCTKEFHSIKQKTEHLYSLYHDATAISDHNFATFIPEENAITIDILEASQVANANKKGKAASVAIQYYIKLFKAQTL